MYVPKHFAITGRGDLVAFIRAHPFGVLVSTVEGRPVATHVPFVLLSDDGNLTLGLHVARANPQWETLDDADVLAIFQGPHGFVSASLYDQPEVSVPTWDYSAVHCSGRAKLTGEAVTDRILRSLVERHEAGTGWSMQNAAPEYISRMRQAIVGIEIAVSAIDGVFKYSQNRSAGERDRVLENLERTSPDLARDMRDFYRAPAARAPRQARGPSTSSG